MQLTQKHIVIVGGSLGIGLETARLATEQGAEVTIISRSQERLIKAADNLNKNVKIAIADITDETSVDRVFASMEKIDHVYIAAGSFIGGNILEGDIEQYRPALESRIWGSAYVVRAVAPKMTAGGPFTFTGGLSTDRPVAGAWITAIATAASEQMARALALELAPIRFNAVAPGWTDTPMWDGIFGDSKQEVFSDVANKNPLKRLANAEEVAQAVIFLMSNNFVTGEVIHIDGGHRYV